LPNPEFLYAGKYHSIALSILDFSLMNDAGFTVVTGEIGSGKTTLIRHFLYQINDTEITVGLVTNTHRSFGELMQWILNAYNLEFAGKSRVEQFQLFTDFMINEYSQNRRVVLIVDEAQNMDLDALEELRLLSNINADSDHILQVVLVGQPQLRDKLRDPSLEQFAQRVLAEYHLEPLSKEETLSYIRHRVQIAGGKQSLFDDYACFYIAYFSKGIPRLINMLCDLALVYGYTQQQQVIGANIIEEVVRDKLKGGLTPLRKPVSKTTSKAAISI
jgi:type II secretory pathway predicted ATPase ExeA